MGGEHFIQIGVEGEEQHVPDFRKNLKIREIKDLIHECDVWVSVDSFLQHLAHHCGPKPGVVVWSVSNPAIFGYPYNTNLWRGVARKKQFEMWEAVSMDVGAFCGPGVISHAILSMVK